MVALVYDESARLQLLERHLVRAEQVDELERRERTRGRARHEADVERARGAATMKDPFAFTLGVVGDLHMDPRDLDDSFEGRSHIKKILDEAGTPGSTYVCSLGDLGESKDCTQTQQLFAGTTPCFELVRDFLDGFGHPYDIVGGNARTASTLRRSSLGFSHHQLGIF